MPAPDDRVNAVSRALSLLDAFCAGDRTLSIRDFRERTGLPKTSVLRLLRTLERAGYLTQTAESQWRLGPAAARLSSRYEDAIDGRGVIRSTLQSLARHTQRPATFFVHEGEVRVLLFKVQHHEGEVPLAVGEPRPLDRGAAGKVILAGQGRPGDPWDSIRRRGFDYTLGEVNTAIASVAAAVCCSRNVLGSVCVSAPRESDLGRGLESAAPAVMEAARTISSALTHTRLAPLASPAAAWHPR